jgi:hypothetical protein
LIPREGVLALAVLQGRTKGYASHPQLERFRKREKSSPVHEELPVERLSGGRGSRIQFQSFEVLGRKTAPAVSVTAGQLRFELQHLRNKLRARNREKCKEIARIAIPEPQPFFKRVPGRIEHWEKTGK